MTMINVKYHRVILKLSGEALVGKEHSSIDFVKLDVIASILKQFLRQGIQIGVVMGGGNFWRGIENNCIERSYADEIGMIITLINCLALKGSCKRHGIDARLLSAIEIPRIAELYSYDKAMDYLLNNKLVIFGAGIGNPYFSTDTCTILRGIETKADVVLLGKNVDAVYSDDPKTNRDAIPFDCISCSEILTKKLEVIDFTATSLAMKNKVPVILFDLKKPEHIIQAINGERVGTYITFE